MNPLTFSQAFDLFSSHRSSYVSLVTRDRSYLPTKRSFIKVLGDRPVDSYTVTDLLTYIGTEVGRKKRVPRGASLTRSPAGVNLNIRVLKAFGNWAVETSILPEGNPFSKMRRLKVPRASRRYLLQEEFTAIDTAEQSPLFRDIYLTALLTGARVSDIVSLTWESIDFEIRVIIFRASKPNMMHRMKLHPMLEERLLARREKYGTAGPTIWGPPIRSEHVSKRFLFAARSAGINDVHFHTLRHTFATWLLKGGLNLFQVQTLMGHKSPQTTMIYAHLQADELGAELARLTPVTGSYISDGIALATGSLEDGSNSPLHVSGSVGR